MSHNHVSRVPRSMGTAYAPDAGGSSQDYYDPGMAGAYAPDASGSAEGDYGWGMNGLFQNRYEPSFLNGLRESGQGIRFLGDLRQQYDGIELEGLLEDNAGVELGRRPHPGRGRGHAWGRMTRDERRNILKDRMRMVRGDRRAIVAQDRLSGLGAADFHPRFDVEFKVNGLGKVRGALGSHQIAGLFDFLKAAPSGDEYIGKLRSLKSSWEPLRLRINKISPKGQAAVIDAMAKMDTSIDAYNRAVTTYIEEGTAGMTSSRVKRVGRLEAALPSIEKLVSQMEASAVAPTTEAAIQVVKQDVVARAEGLDLQKYAVPAAIVGGAGLALFMGYQLIKR